jgi:hypothetical protein
MSDNLYWNLAQNPDKLGLAEERRGLDMSGKRLWNPAGNRICLDFLERLVGSYFLTISTSPTHSMHPLDSMEFLGHN